MNVAVFAFALVGALLHLFQGFISLPPLGEINFANVILWCISFFSEITSMISNTWSELNSFGEKAIFVIIVLILISIILTPFSAIYQGFKALLRRKDAYKELRDCAIRCVICSGIMFFMAEKIKSSAYSEIGILAELAHSVMLSYVPLIWAALYAIAAAFAYADEKNTTNQKEQWAKVNELIDNQRTPSSAQQKNKQATEETEKIYKPILGVETEALIKRANLFLEDGEFDEADRYFEQALNQDPENSDAYLGKLMVLRRVCNVDELFESPVPVANTPLFQKVLRFVDGETRTRLESQAQTQLEAFSKVEKLIEERKSVYSGNCLGSTFTEEHGKAIKSGTFEGMALGDYWAINEMNWRIADFDYLAYSDKAEVDISKHHLIIVPDKILYKGNMSSVSWRDVFKGQEPVTTGGYARSEMRSSGLGPALETIKAAFGEEHILTYRGCIEDDKSNGGIWTDCGIELMTKEMIFGDKAFSLFRLHKDSIEIGAFFSGYWLQDVASETEFYNVSNVGKLDKTKIDNPLLKEGVRPFFALY